LKKSSAEKTPMTKAVDFQTVVNGQISNDTLLALLDRWDETRAFMIQFWLDNPKMANQGGRKVLNLVEPLEQVQKYYAEQW
jgi:hypothetical protein